MTSELGSRRRAWRWAVVVWAIAVAVAGGLTLWLQDSAQPRPPARWERADPSQEPAAPLLKGTACPHGDGTTIVVCVYARP
ncbi:hypothetical protein ACWCRD_31775 [Streptomyces sp. NPDC002092]